MTRGSAYCATVRDDGNDGQATMLLTLSVAFNWAPDRPVALSPAGRSARWQGEDEAAAVALPGQRSQSDLGQLPLVQVLRFLLDLHRPAVDQGQRSQ